MTGEVDMRVRARLLLTELERLIRARTRDDLEPKCHNPGLVREALGDGVLNDADCLRFMAGGRAETAAFLLRWILRERSDNDDRNSGDL